MSHDRAFFALAKERFKQGEEANRPQRLREIADLEFYDLKQWDSDVLRSREGTTIGAGTTTQVVPARPSLVIDGTAAPVRQILNQERQSDMGIEIIPADDFGEMTGPIDHTEIELREGLVRRIQRDSEAADARTWAFGRSTIAGQGYYGVMTRYVPKSWDQEVYIQRFYNQNSITLDPTHEQPDGSDAAWAFVGVDMPWEEYRAQFGERNGKKNRIVDASESDFRQLGDESPDWFTTEGKTRSVRVVEYWYTALTTTTLYQLSNGKAATKTQIDQGLPPGLTVMHDDKGKPITRPDVTKQIKWAKLDGCDDDVLEETDWPGHYIPIVKVVGEELQPYDKERRARGVVRPMRDACIGKNYIISKFVERVGTTPISPWMMATGQDEGYDAEYNAVNTRALSRLHYNQVDSFGKPAPPPFRTDARAEIADIGMGLQLFNQAIASTSVTPETALGNADPTVKSGKLAKMLLQQAERGTSNFLDNLVRSMRHETRIVNDLLYPIYGVRPGRLARMMNPEGEMSAVLVGQPFTFQGEGKQARPMPAPDGHPEAKTYRLTPDAEFNVAIKISKNYDTRREQEAETLGEIIAADPTQMGVIGDLFFKYQDGPGHEEMSERYKAVLVPPVQALVSGTPQIPPELQAQMAQMQQQMQQLQQEADKNRTDLMKAQMDNQTKIQIAQAELASKEKLVLIQQAGQLAAVDAKIDAENARTFVDAAQNKIGRELDLHMIKLDQIHQAMTQGRDHAHELRSAELGQTHALEQGQQAAALQPAPSEAEA